MKQDKMFEETREITDEDIVDMAQRAADLKRNILSLEAKLGVFKKATSEIITTMTDEMNGILRQIHDGKAEVYGTDYAQKRSDIQAAKRPFGVIVEQIEGKYEVKFGNEKQ
jgi:hypothetical protein